MPNWVKYLIVGALTLLVLPAIGSILKFGVSIAFRIGLFIFVGYIVVNVYNAITKKKKKNTYE